MKKYSLFFFYSFIVAFFSCSGPDQNNDLKLQTVKQSSSILKCDKMFAEHILDLEEKNEILLQTGIIDTTDQHSRVAVAILNANGKEIVLHQISLKNSGNGKEENYSGDGYNLKITYTENTNNFRGVIYKGQLELEKGQAHRQYKIEGKICIL